MDRLRFSAIAHSTHTFCSPIAESDLTNLLSQAELTAGSRVVDFGCGNGGMAAFVAARFGAAVDAVERSPFMVELARERAAGVGPPGSVTVHESSAADFAGGQTEYDLALAVGVDFLFGQDRAAMYRGLARTVKPGGHVLFADGYLAKKPTAEYLESLGCTEADIDASVEPGDDAAEAGLAVVAEHQSTVADWDEYEGLYSETMEAYLAAHPDDPDAAAMRDRIRKHNDGYRNHGRGVLGFAFHLLKKA